MRNAGLVSRAFSFACLSATLAISTGVHAVAPYDFESLAVNHFIDGQDNWQDRPGQGQAYVGQDDSGVNGTKVVRHLHTVVFNQSAFLTRVNDSDYAFRYPEGTLNPTIQFDVTGEHIGLFTLGCDVNGDGLLTESQGETGPSFGAWGRDFRVQGAAAGTVLAAGFNDSGRGGNSGNDWYRLQLRMDLTANGGEGSASLYYRNLTDADAVFEPIVEMQEFSLELTRMHPDVVVGHWNAMWVHVLSGGSSIPSVDHLVPLVTVRDLSFSPDGLTLSWSPLSTGTRYDVIRGNLAVLRDTGGDAGK